MSTAKVNNLQIKSSETKDYYDVVIIGAGVGGLTTGALLSKAGLSVLILEKEPVPGGYLSGFKRGSFRFDTAIHWLNQYGPEGMVTKVFKALGKDYPKSIIQNRIRRYKGDSFDFLLTNEPDKLKEQWIKDFPNEKEGIERFFNRAKKIGEAFSKFNLIFRSSETMTVWEQIKRIPDLIKFGSAFLPYIRFTGEKGLQKGLDKYFKDKELQKLFHGNTELLSCLVPIGWAYYKDYQSAPLGGGQVITEWLQHIVEYYSNTVKLRSQVNKVLVENGKAKGVQFTHKGKDLQAKCKYVIAACDLETLYNKMLPKEFIKSNTREKFNNAALYSSSFTISIALDCPAEQLGFNEELVSLINEAVPLAHNESDDPERTELSIIAPSCRDKSLAPEGSGTLMLYMPASIQYSNYWNTGKDKSDNYVRNEEYSKLKNDLALKLIKRVEDKLAPGLSSHILFYDVATPITHWRYTGNKDGTIMGARPGKKNMQSKVAHYRTPVKNLFVSGHWAELGGGVPIAVKAAANSALIIFKEEKLKAFKLFSDYLDGKIDEEKLLASGDFGGYDHSWKQQLTPAQRKEALKVI